MNTLLSNTSINTNVTSINTNVKVCNNNCPICLEVVEDGIVTNCGHRYCMDCIINFLKHHYENNDIRYYLRNINGKICCPLCKTRVHIFTPMSSSHPLDSIINNYNNDIHPNQDIMTKFNLSKWSVINFILLFIFCGYEILILLFIFLCDSILIKFGLINAFIDTCLIRENKKDIIISFFLILFTIYKYFIFEINYINILYIFACYYLQLFIMTSFYMMVLKIHNRISLPK